MSESGVKHVYFGEDDYADRMINTVATDGVTEPGNFVVTLIKDKTESLPIPNGTKVVIIDDHDNKRLFGAVRSVVPKYDAQKVRLEVTVDTPANSFARKAVSYPLIGMKISDAFQYLIESFADMNQNVIGTIPEMPDRMTYNIKSNLRDALLQLLELEGTGYQWKVTINSSNKWVHSVERPYVSRAASIEEVIYEGSQPFEDNKTTVVNTLLATVNDVVFDEKEEQNWLFDYNPIAPVEGVNLDVLGIPLSYPPEGLQCFVMVGDEPEEASLIELKVVDYVSGQPINVNIKNHVGIRKTAPNYMTNQITSRSMTSPTSFLPTNYPPIDPTSVESSLIGGYFIQALTTKYDKNAEAGRPDTKNGKLWVFSKDYLLQYASQLFEIGGNQFDVNKIIGYKLVYSRRGTFSDYFYNNDSFIADGEIAAEPVTIQAPNLTFFRKIAQAMIDMKAQSIRSGQAVFKLYDGGERVYTDVISPGQIVDVDMGIWGNENDLQVKTIQQHITGHTWTVTISAETRSRKSLYEAFLKKLMTEVKLLMSPTSLEGFVGVHKMTDTVTLTEGTPVATQITDGGLWGTKWATARFV